MDLSQIIRALRALPEAQDMSVVTGGLDLLVRLRVRDHAHLRELLLGSIFQIPGIQRTETFLSLADIETDNFAEALLDQMSRLNQTGQRGRPGDKARGGGQAGGGQAGADKTREERTR
jgi:Lrp/AsnC family transcriptional regulator, leucine-responsive regulatory protein